MKNSKETVTGSFTADTILTFVGAAALGILIALGV